jgi:hypothetical protein
MAVAEFARECITLPERVLSAEQNGVDDVEVDWTFGPAVAQTVATGLAAVAGLMEPQLLQERGTIGQSQVVELLMDLSQQIDCLAPYLFSGLCRAEVHRQWEDDASDASLQAALQSICAWALVAVGRIMGYEKLSADVLWDWGAKDALWVLVLAKGALALDGRIDNVARGLGYSADAASALEGSDMWALAVPPDLAEMQLAVAKAVLGLASPTLAFGSEMDQSEDSGGVAITQRAAQLAWHRAQLAMTIAESQLLGPLIAACSGLTSAERPKIATFLALVLQPELGDEPEWADSSFGSEVFDSAREATTMLRLQLTWSAGELWALLASVAAAGPMPRTFLKDCAYLAFATLSDEPRSLANVLRILRHGVASPDNTASTVAALCMLAANSRIAPAGTSLEDGGLSQLLQQLDLDQRIEALGYLKAWRGATRRSNVLMWLYLLVADSNDQKATHIEAEAIHFHEPAAVQPPSKPSAPTRIAGAPTSGMRDLLNEAPSELRCALDGRLVTDPVRAPSGLIFERAVLARALMQSHGVCPITGQPIKLEDCPRDADIRRQAVDWIRVRRAANRN